MSHWGAFEEYSGEGFIWRERGNEGRRWPPTGESVSGLRQGDPRVDKKNSANHVELVSHYATTLAFLLALPDVLMSLAV